MSVLNFEKKFIFIHIPKTAGTSMEDRMFMHPIISRHLGIDYYIDLVKNTDVGWEELFKFAFVRNPYDRVASAVVNHAMKGSLVNMETFNEFLFKHQDMLPKWVATRPQYTFVYIDGKLMVDFVGRFEKLKGDWRYVCARLGEKPILNHLVKSGRSYKELHTPESKKLIQKVYKKDFELFGYEK